MGAAVVLLLRLVNVAAVGLAAHSRVGGPPIRDGRGKGEGEQRRDDEEGFEHCEVEGASGLEMEVIELSSTSCVTMERAGLTKERSETTKLRTKRGEASEWGCPMSCIPLI